ncbi:hypothetical protein [Bhargavaea beijingensis]|uniref:Uncharacterized protein n=1 Tax=Bhargavaea beijingensis TaxID=426756 RepID=A0ABX9ZCF7_9BACL|nr:hypothetical protein [Bhargavaea beijingensis]RSK30962.1 hypothetical protein EJA12_09605 [Bhargavaea beijingensis]
MRFIGGEEFKLILHSEQHLAKLRKRHAEELQDLYDDVSPVMVYMDPMSGKAFAVHKSVEDAAIEICEVKDRQAAERARLEARCRQMQNAMQLLTDAHRNALMAYLNNPSQNPPNATRDALDALRDALEGRQGATA